MSADPLIIFGTGRCGSSLLFRLCAYHPDFTWLTGVADRFPGRPALNRAAVWAATAPGIGPILRQRRFEPQEAYGFWERYAPGFARPTRDLGADDLTTEAARSLTGAFAKITTPKRRRLILKITGWPRIGYLKALFPKAQFIHVVRDGRAVANSLLQVSWWDGWQGPENWRWGPLSAENAEIWERHGHGFVALAAINWNLLMDVAEETARPLGSEAFLSVRYEDLCGEPDRMVRQILDFAGLDYPEHMQRRNRSVSVETRNYKWKEDLAPRQQEILADVMGSRLKKHGYL